MQLEQDHFLDIINNYRYERKYTVSSKVPIKELISLVKSNTGFFREVYYKRQINNIYFDSEAFKFYFDNVDGVADRQKVRIRWYGNTFEEISKPKLEIKIKKGLVGDKWTYNLSPFVLNNGFSGNVYKDILKNSNLPLPILEMVRHLKPTLLNSYSRQYFLSADEKFRITLDYDILYRKIDLKINNFNKFPQPDENNVVELKYGLEDDQSANIISNQFPFRMSKNSKYVNGVNNFQTFPE